MINRSLEIGVGGSNHLDIYAQGKGRKVFGIDIRQDVAERRKKDTPNGVFIVADAHNLPFASGIFDEAFATNSLEHVDNPGQVLREAHRTLKHKGRITIDVPHPRYDRVMGWLANKDGAYHRETHKQVFKPQEIFNITQEAGFKVTEFSTRMWKSAVKLTTRWLVARALGKLDYDPDTGELLSLPPERKGIVRREVDRLLWLSENKSASPKRYYLLSLLRLPNLIYPWATYIEAIKE